MFGFLFLISPKNVFMAVVVFLLMFCLLWLVVLE
jgi:hypothetical protein